MTSDRAMGYLEQALVHGFERAIELFRQHGGGFRMAEALRLGVSRKTLYAMRDAGVVEAVSRGVYRLASLEPLERQSG